MKSKPKAVKVRQSPALKKFMEKMAGLSEAERAEFVRRFNGPRATVEEPIQLSRKAALEGVFRAGARMSNLCFNLSQRKGEHQKTFKKSHLEWDEAVGLYRVRQLAASRGVAKSK